VGSSAVGVGRRVPAPPRSLVQGLAPRHQTGQQWSPRATRVRACLAARGAPFGPEAPQRGLSPRHPRVPGEPSPSDAPRVAAGARRPSSPAMGRPMAPWCRPGTPRRHRSPSGADLGGSMALRGRQAPPSCHRSPEKRRPRPRPHQRRLRGPQEHEDAVGRPGAPASADQWHFGVAGSPQAAIDLRRSAGLAFDPTDGAFVSPRNTKTPLVAQGRPPRRIDGTSGAPGALGLPSMRGGGCATLARIQVWMRVPAPGPAAAQAPAPNHHGRPTHAGTTNPCPPLSMQNPPTPRTTNPNPAPDATDA